MSLVKPLFDVQKISEKLLERKSVVWFSDIPNKDRTLSDEVLARIRECAESWDGYVHIPFEHRYDEFALIKNRNNYEDPYINRRACLADMIIFEFFIGEGKYLSKIDEMIKLICSERTWCVPSHFKTKTKETTDHVIELYAAETASVLAFASYLLSDKLSADIKRTVAETIDERIFVPYTETDKYGWMGADGRRVNNWNPWINSNIMLTAAMNCEDEEKYRALVIRAVSLTENYVRSLADDYLCDEGVRYFALSGSCLFDISEILYDLTGGEVDLTKSEVVRSACDYATGMYDEYGNPANFADATIDFYPQCATLARAGDRTANPTLSAMGRALYTKDTLRAYHDNFYRQIKDIYTASGFTERSVLKYPEAKHLRSIDIFTVRRDGFFFSLKGGHNGESHNHNDVGNFVLYYRGTPIFIDAGVDFYSGYTFSQDRFKLWYMRSEFHSVPTLNGKTQSEGKQFAASPMKIDGLSAEIDVSGAYGADSDAFIRSTDVTDEGITITDTFKSLHGTTLNYILKDNPRIEGNALIFPSGIRAELSGVSDISIEAIDVTGTNPPDGIVGDALNRTDMRSYLIPRMMHKQWKKNEIYKLTAIPTQATVTMKVYKM